MADGTQRPIDLAAGDEVRSGYGSLAGHEGAARVLARHRSVRTDGIAITLRSGRRLVSTPEHVHFAGSLVGDQYLLDRLFVEHDTSRRGAGLLVDPGVELRSSALSPQYPHRDSGSTPAPAHFAMRGPQGKDSDAPDRLVRLRRAWATDARAARGLPYCSSSSPRLGWLALRDLL